MVSYEVVSPLKVFHSFVKNWVFGYRDGIDIVTHEGKSLKDHSKVSHGVQNPYNLGAVASSGYILSLCGGLSN
jgi:hypothetical protein